MNETPFKTLIDYWQPFFQNLPRPYWPIDLKILTIVWNHKMRSRAGLCRPREKLIELNPHILKDSAALENVFLHEICHMAVTLRFPFARPHGQKWKKLMELCGQDPKRCHEFGTPFRRPQKRWDYRCFCQTHRVSTVVSNRIKRGKKYKCLKCGYLLKDSSLKLSGPEFGSQFQGLKK